MVFRSLPVKQVISLLYFFFLLITIKKHIGIIRMNLLLYVCIHPALFLLEVPIPTVI